MVFDWQTIAVAFVILGALLYVARRALARLGSFRVRRDGSVAASSCATGCGGCGGESKEVAAPARTLLVQIGRSGTTRGDRRERAKI